MRRVRTTALVMALVLGGPAAAQGQGQAQAAEHVSWHVDVPVDEVTYHPATAGRSTSDLATLWANGSVTSTVDLPAPATHLLFDARADRCDGVGANLEVRVDGELVLAHQVVDNNLLRNGTRVLIDAYQQQLWASSTYRVVGSWEPGPHHLSFRFTNDRFTDTCDRNLKLSRIRLAGPGDDPEAAARVELRQFATMILAEIEPSSAGTAARPELWSPGTMRFRVDSLDARLIEILAWRHCGTEPVEIRIDGEPILSPERVFRWGWRLRSYEEAFGRPGEWADGPHVIEVELLPGDERDCEHLLGVEHIRFLGPR